MVTKIRIKLSGSTLKQDKLARNHRKMKNMYVVYNISSFDSNSNYSRLENWLFGAVSSPKDAHIFNYKYCGYGVVLDLIEKEPFHLIMDLAEIVYFWR